MLLPLPDGCPAPGPAGLEVPAGQAVLRQVLGAWGLGGVALRGRRVTALALREARIEALRQHYKANPPPPMTEEQATILRRNFGELTATRRAA